MKPVFPASIPSLAHLISSVTGVYWVVGTIIIVLAAVSLITQMSLYEILHFAQKHLGKTYLVLYTGLVGSGLWAIHRLWISKDNTFYWSEMGFQMANGISTLALTFTLFGISMGIGSLSTQALTPENVDKVVASLTQQFSIAFMTTVIGLPTAALLRAIISIKLAQRQGDELRDDPIHDNPIQKQKTNVETSHR